MSTTPINEAGITATFAAIFARLDALESAKQPDPWPTIEALITRIEELEAAESARIAPQEAPESAVTASGVPMEPGNATEAHGAACPASQWSSVVGACTCDPEVAAALRMYRKVQALTVAEACGIMRVTYELAAPEVTALLAWLKEGEA